MVHRSPQTSVLHENSFLDNPKLGHVRYFSQLGTNIAAALHRRYSYPEMLQAFHCQDRLRSDVQPEAAREQHLTWNP